MKIEIHFNMHLMNPPIPLKDYIEFCGVLEETKEKILASNKLFQIVRSYGFLSGDKSKELTWVISSEKLNLVYLADDFEDKNFFNFIDFNYIQSIPLISDFSGRLVFDFEFPFRPRITAYHSDGGFAEVKKHIEVLYPDIVKQELTSGILEVFQQLIKQINKPSGGLV